MSESSSNGSTPPAADSTDPLFLILKRLNDHGVRYAVVGATAAIVHGASVVTQDVDVCVPLDLDTWRSGRWKR